MYRKGPGYLRALIGRYFGWAFSFFPSRDGVIARLQMDRFIPGEGGSGLLRGVYASLGENLLECMNLKPILDNYQSYVEADWAQWDEFLSRKKGIVILSAHTGNWDLLAACSVKRGYEVSVIGKEMKIASFQDFLQRVRGNYGVATLWRAGSAGVKQIVDELRHSRCVAALIDQDIKVINRMIPFFGCPASTPSTMIELAKRCDAIIVAPFIFRTGTNRYKIIVKELDTSLSTDEILKDFNDTLESVIRKHPSQWVWFHKRWRTMEDGSRLSTKDYITYLQSGAGIN